MKGVYLCLVDAPQGFHAGMVGQDQVAAIAGGDNPNPHNMPSQWAFKTDLYKTR
jgi:hypothetical protein